MTKTLNTLVASYFTHVDAAALDVIELRKTLKGQRVSLSDRKALRAALIEATALQYGITLVAKEKGEGVTWNLPKRDEKSTPVQKKHQAAKKQLDRLVGDIAGKVESQSEELDVPAHIAKLAAQLVAACGEYEGAAKLIATAIANAKAAK